MKIYYGGLLIIASVVFLGVYFIKFNDDFVWWKDAILWMLFLSSFTCTEYWTDKVQKQRCAHNAITLSESAHFKGETLMPCIFYIKETRKDRSING